MPVNSRIIVQKFFTDVLGAGFLKNYRIFQVISQLLNEEI